MTFSPQQIAEELKRTAKIERPDCGDNSCRFAVERGGMRTNGGCRCFRDMSPGGRAYFLRLHSACSPDRILALVEDWERLDKLVDQSWHGSFFVASVKDRTGSNTAGEDFLIEFDRMKAENVKLRAAAKEAAELMQHDNHYYPNGQTGCHGCIVLAKLREAGIE